MFALFLISGSVLSIDLTSTTGSLKITKREKGKGLVSGVYPPLPGVEFKIYKVSDTETSTTATVTERELKGTGITGVDGTVTFSELELGRYLVIETDAPEAVLEKTANFLVDIPSTNATGDGLIYNVEVEAKNETVYGGVVLTKQNKNGTALKGVTFKLQKLIETNWEDHDDSVDNEKTFVFGNCNDVTWYDMTNHFEAVKKVAEQYRVWVGYKTNGVINYWAYQNALSDSDYVDLILDVAYDEMYCVNTAVFTQVGTETLLGRTCNKYTCQGKLYYTLWEDAATGVTMKLEARSNSSDATPKYFQKVTEFKTGSDVTIPDLPLPQS